jgi:chromosome segregation ATPase
MDFEEPQSPLEEKRKILEDKRNRLKDAIEEAKDMLVRHENESKEHKELEVIIDGLYKKAEALTNKDKELSIKMPETDEEWDAWIARTERIQALYEKITDLENESGDVAGKIKEIEAEFDRLQRDTDTMI